MADEWGQIRESIWGTPGFQRWQSTVVSQMPLSGATRTYVVETVRTKKEMFIFLQYIDESGGQRFILPTKVCEAIYRHREANIKEARKRAGKEQAQTRMSQGVVPFKKKEA